MTDRASSIGTTSRPREGVRTTPSGAMVEVRTPRSPPRAFDASPSFYDSPALGLARSSPRTRSLEDQLDAVLGAIVSARKDVDALSPFRARAGSPARRRGGRSTPTSGSGGSSSWSARAAALAAELSGPGSGFSSPSTQHPLVDHHRLGHLARLNSGSGLSHSGGLSPLASPGEVDALRREVADLRARLDATAAQLADERRARHFGAHPPSSSADDSPTPRLAEEPTRAALAAARAEAAAANARADKLQHALSEMLRGASAATDALVECGGGGVGGGGAEREVAGGGLVRGAGGGDGGDGVHRVGSTNAVDTNRSPRPSRGRLAPPRSGGVGRRGASSFVSASSIARADGFSSSTEEIRFVFVLYRPSSIIRAMS